MAAVKKVTYVRNKRPNRLKLRDPKAGYEYALDRRGARGDQVAVPGEIFEEPSFQRQVKLGLIEEISKEEFFKLEERTEDEPQGRLKPPPQVHWEITQNYPNATQIEHFPPEWLSPHLEFADDDDDEIIQRIVEEFKVTPEQAVKMLTVFRESQ